MNKIFSRDIIQYFEQNLVKAKDNYALLFRDLKEKYRGAHNASLYNYILENKEDINLLTATIKEITSSLYMDNLDSLLDFLIKIEDSNLKILTIKAIAKYKNKKAIPILAQVLSDKNSNYKVRFTCADALGKIGDKNAFDVLGLVVSDEEEKSAYVKESAVVALGNLGDKRAIDVFSSIMSSKQMFLDKFTYLKERIVEAISKLDIQKDDKALEILRKSILDSSPQIRISSIEAIMNSSSIESYDLIYDRLVYDDDMEVRENALIALYNLTDRKILDEVISGDFPFELKEFSKDLIKEYEDDSEE